MDEEYCLELTPDFYGWIPSFLAKKFENSSSKINLSYPIVNNLPLLNIYFSDKRILQEILNFYKIDKKKQNEFFKQIDLCNILTKEDIKNVLDLSEKSKILLYLGTKTTFWKVEFEDEYFVCDAIFCAIPKKDETEKIEKYEILEANFEKKCSL